MHHTLLLIAAFAVIALIAWLWSKEKTESYTVKVRLGCVTAGALTTPRNAQDYQVLVTSRALVADLLRCLKRQRKSTNAKKILRVLSPANVHLFAGEGASGGRLVKSGQRVCLFINPDEPDNRNIARLQSKICHEVAHITGRGHDKKWLSTWRYLLNLTSRELGWTNTLECGSCIKYNLCNRRECPRCRWEEGDHGSICQPLTSRGVLLDGP